ncbi:hypothetical protein FOYG_16964 [Fusarium oxysporum NRRL 32931]|uniref:Xylanolytic transcriptional activator regulatory domain-containing protein n=1 Tax=Fusarium oxysporum NRRL 32931 TaxID=660029 RepID=W9HFY9_FUSOX|nr:hypothetical protein FOYG_16964 [Fusarium oxysporum NRRL 32931]
MTNLPAPESQLRNSMNQRTNSQSEDIISISQVETSEANNHYLIVLYYQYIHPAHPFLLPQKLYQENPTVFPDHLKRAIYFIASHHSSSDTEQLRDASNTVFSSSIINDGFKVQSLILVTLASYERFQRDRGNRAFSTAINVTHRISLNSNAFCRDHEPLFRESWRRTWWELYTIAGLISLISGTNIRLSQPVSMTLPCDCEAYDMCLVPHMGNVKEMQQRFPLEAPLKWSSFAYKVESMRIHSMVLDANTRGCTSTKQSAEDAISSWLLSLPTDKHDSLHPDGEVDEVMSCSCFKVRQGTGETIDIASRLENALSMLFLRNSLLLHRATRRVFDADIPEATVSSRELTLLGQAWSIARVVRSQIAGFARDVTDKVSASSCTDAVTELAPITLDDQWFQDLLSENVILLEEDEG